MNENINTVHFTHYVPDLVPDENKTFDQDKVTCEACRQTLREVAVSDAAITEGLEAHEDIVIKETGG